MNTDLTAEFFANNRQALRKRFGGTAPILLTANGQLQRSGDTPFPFRQDSNFWYLTGINEPDIVLVIDKSKEYLIVPERDERLKTFDGDLDLEELKRRSGIEVVIDSKEAWSGLSKRLKRVKHVATIEPAPAYIASLQLYPNPARRKLVKLLKSYNPELQFIDLKPHFSALRMVKSEIELSMIQQAIDHTGEIFDIITKNLASYQSENEVAADVAAYLLRNQLIEAYAPIIAGGKNAVTLHYVKNSAPLTPGECLLLDIGAAKNYYSADISRTLCIKPIKRQKAVFEAVKAVQDFAVSLLKPGATIKDVETEVEHFMGEKLRELGLIRTIDHENVRTFYPHATSHFLGLDVHDVGDYHKPLEPGVVLTVEPGIYIAHESLGVRIEDNIVITAEGNRNLSAHLPKALEG
jgi:Xaa-Pro aminopeptidase